MRIGILTQPLHNNYGGLLQAYALQHFLKTLGHSPITVDFSSKRKPKLWGIKRIAINSIKKYILKHDIKFIMPINSKNTEEFITEYIDKTAKIATLDELSLLSQYNFDAYIVGSDQVWRPSYSPGMSAFFLEFLGGIPQLNAYLMRLLLALITVMNFRQKTLSDIQLF
ncbi:polysaccharide pyruvyl transferase family protein [Providencia huaxiensis]